ncbi:MAG TPA: hypothetical protein DDZ53_03400, partial [Firmicutes bacterium]|nr:hypothetical protein [Bacillota bacterium]
MNFWVEEVESYLGEKQNTNILLRIVGKLNNGQFDAAQATVLADNIDHDIPVEEMFPARPEEL